jgi:serine/threonine protein kinase
MELLKTEYTYIGGMINKFKLNCDQDKDKWLNLIKLLYKSHNNTALIIEGLYNNTKNIVLKVGFLNAIEKEFEIANKLKEFPNFLRYYCIFNCNDSIMNIINNQHMISNYKMCNYGNNPVGILTMNYYKLGSIGNYLWNKINLNILKNVLRQTIFSVLYVYEKIGFIHGDLHPNNVLLKDAKTDEITFGSEILKINTFEVRIMDFEKSKVDTNDFYVVVKNIQKLLDNLCDIFGISLHMKYKQSMIKKMFNDSQITDEHYKKFYDVVETLEID